MDVTETTDESRAEARATLGNPAVYVALILIALCLIYVLSIGPAIALLVLTGLIDNDAALSVVDVVYAPVFYLAGYPPLSAPFDGYMEWWEGQGHRFR